MKVILAVRMKWEAVWSFLLASSELSYLTRIERLVGALEVDYRDLRYWDFIWHHAIVSF